MSREGAKLVIAVMYEGPWERLSTRLLAIDPVTLEIRHEIKTNGLRDRLAAWCDKRDHAWRNRWVDRASQRPPDRYRRGRRLGSRSSS